MWWGPIWSILNCFTLTSVSATHFRITFTHWQVISLHTIGLHCAHRYCTSRWSDNISLSWGTKWWHMLFDQIRRWNCHFKQTNSAIQVFYPHHTYIALKTLGFPHTICRFPTKNLRINSKPIPNSKMPNLLPSSNAMIPNVPKSSVSRITGEIGYARGDWKERTGRLPRRSWWRFRMTMSKPVLVLAGVCETCLAETGEVLLLISVIEMPPLLQLSLSLCGPQNYQRQMYIQWRNQSREGINLWLSNDDSFHLVALNSALNNSNSPDNSFSFRLHL